MKKEEEISVTKALLIFILIAIGIHFLAVWHNKGNQSSSERPTDCEYDAYHGWNCQ